MKRFLTLLILLGSCLCTNAKQLPGYIVRPDGDTLWVQFQVQATKKKASFVKNQEAVVYFDKQGKKQLLMPAQARVLGFRWGRDTIQLYSFQNTVGIRPLSLDDDGYQFFQLEESGKVKLFSFLEPASTYTGGGAIGGAAIALTHSPMSYFVQYNEQSLFRVRPLSFKRDMADYFREHEALAHKIEQGEWGFADLEQIVREFNRFRASDAYQEPAVPTEGF